MYYLPPHLKNVANLPHYLWEVKVQISYKSGRKSKQKMSHEPVTFHSYRKIKPWANFEFTSFIVLSIIDKQLKIIKNDTSTIDTVRITVSLTTNKWRGRLHARMCLSKRWRLWTTVVTITISVQPYEWNFNFFWQTWLRVLILFCNLWQIWTFRFPKVVWQRT